jgi:hypothetical protein
MRRLDCERYLLREQLQELPGGRVNRRRFIAERRGRGRRPQWLLVEENDAWGPRWRPIGVFATLREAEEFSYKC